MKTWCAILLAALLLTSVNLTVSAQGGIVIRKKTDEATAGPKAPKKTTKSMVVIRGDDGQEHRVELKNESKREVIDLGNGKKAIILIETDGDQGHDVFAVEGEDLVVLGDEDFDGWAKSHMQAFAKEQEKAHPGMTSDDDDCCEIEIECEDDCCESDCDVDCDVDVQWEADGMEPLISGFLKNFKQEDIQALAPLAGQFLSQMDMEGLAPMVGKIMENIDVDFENGHVKFNGQDMDWKALLKAHGHDLDEGDHVVEWHAAAPGIEVEIAEANCECDCECKCCKQGSCPNAAKKGGHALFSQVHPQGTAPRQMIIRRRGEDKGDARPHIERRIVVAPHGGNAFGVHPGPKAPMPPQAPRVTKRERIIKLQPTEIPQDAKHRIMRWKQADNDHGLEDIESRIERLADEMQALQKELRSMKKKI